MLATAEKELGLEITQEQLDEMAAHLDDIDFDYANEKEREFRHDVMGHVHAFGAVCPTAMPIIHLGATSCFVGDNTDLIQLKESMQLLLRKLAKLMDCLRTFALAQKDVATLGFTHFQAAQPVTVGKRASLWLQDFLIDFHQLERMIDELPARGVKGTTGSQASFLELFNGDHEKVKKLNGRVVELLGFGRAVGVSGQTYTRKYDYMVVSLLSQIAQSAYKMCGDIRLLANMKEIEEPFGKNQIGSSAMAYKRNPMRSERVCSLARYVMSLPNSTAATASNQWFERTLDDSANRRVVLPEAFLTVDVVLGLCQDISSGMQVWPAVVAAHLNAELPFMATEVILMQCVKAGGDRQVLHEAIREHSMAAGAVVKGQGKPNDLLERIATDPLFSAVHGKLDELMDPSLFVGRCPEQVVEFIDEEVTPVLEKHKALLEVEDVDKVNV